MKNDGNVVSTTRNRRSFLKTGLAGGCPRVPSLPALDQRRTAAVKLSTLGTGERRYRQFAGVVTFL